jgi:hypothetical protein
LAGGVFPVVIFSASFPQQWSTGADQGQDQLYILHLLNHNLNFTQVWVL